MHGHQRGTSRAYASRQPVIATSTLHRVLRTGTSCWSSTRTAASPACSHCPEPKTAYPVGAHITTLQGSTSKLPIDAWGCQPPPLKCSTSQNTVTSRGRKPSRACSTYSKARVACAFETTATYLSLQKSGSGHGATEEQETVLAIPGFLSAVFYCRTHQQDV